MMYRTLFAKYVQGIGMPLFQGKRPRMVLAMVFICICVVPFCLALVLPSEDTTGASEKGPPEIHDLSIINSDQRLLAYFSLKNGFTPEVVEALKSGIPVRYTFDVELLAPGFLWKKQLLSLQVPRVVSFDSLKGEYRVMFGPVVHRVVTVRTLNEAKRLVCDVNDVPLIPLGDLEKGVQYTLRVRARAEKSVSSLPFEGLMKIFSSWGIETSWYEIHFSY